MWAAGAIARRVRALGPVECFNEHDQAGRIRTVGASNESVERGESQV